MSAIAYVHEPAPVYGVVEWMSPLVRRVMAPNPSKFTYHGSGTYLIGRGSVAVIDPGPASLPHIEAILRALEPGEVVSHILITHTHSDHSPGARLLQERMPAPTHGFGPHGAVYVEDPTDVIIFGDAEADGKPAAPNAGGHELREGADTDFIPDVVLADGAIVQGGSWTIQAVHTPGHTSNHLCFDLVEEGTLFTGDHVMGWSTSVIGPPDGSLGQYLASLRVLLARDDQRYRPTHGPAITAPRELVSSYVAHRLERTEQIVAALRHGPATIATLVPIIYSSVSKALWRPAAASMYAHLLQLLDDGRVVATEPGRLTSAFELV